jgi:hypothetical protein
LQAMFDSVIASRIHAWVHIQEGALHALPVYMTIRLDDPCDDEEEQVEFPEGNALCGVGPAMLCPEAPDQYLVLAPKFDALMSEGRSSECLSKGGFKWRTHLLGSACEVGGNAEVNTPPVQQLAAQVEEKIEEKLLVTPPGEALAVKRADMHQRPSLPPGLSLESANAEPVYLAPPKGFGDSPVNGDEEAGGLKNHLKTLVHEDSNAVLIVRGITKLGHESADRLSAHFAAHNCPLKDVHVPNVFKKRRSCKSAGEALARSVAKQQEKRVAGRCFIVFRSAEDAARVLAQGPEHVVDGVLVMIHPFDLEGART